MLNFSASSDPVFEQSLSIVLGSVPVAELEWVASYEDLGPDDLDLATETGITTNTTPVTVVPVPPVDSNSYQLKSFNIKNQNSASIVVIVQYNDSGDVNTPLEIIRVTLAQHDSFVYEQASGWMVIDSLGAKKVTFRITDQGIYAQSAPSAATLTDLITISSGFYVDAHVVAVNRGGATTIRMSLAPNGAGDATSQYFGGYDLPISANNVYDSAEIIADESDVVRVYNTDANVTFSIFAKRKPNAQ